MHYIATVSYVADKPRHRTVKVDAPDVTLATSDIKLRAGETITKIERQQDVGEDSHGMWVDRWRRYSEPGADQKQHEHMRAFR